MIPKHIYQTWKTKDLHPNVQQVRNRIQQLNPEYTMHLYDDADMLNFLRENYAPSVATAFQMLAVGAAKADLWRYCILYARGGVYLDIDAKITDSLDTLINQGNRGIITREGNPGIFCQWILLFEPRHPFLYMMIENCVRNILNKTTHNIMFLTGPILFTNTLNAYLESDQNTYYLSDSEFNAKYSDKLRVYEIDMGKYAKYKHECVDNLYEGAHVYWQNEKTIYNNF